MFLQDWPSPNPILSPPTPPTPPRAKHIPHTPPTPLTTLISCTSPALDKTPEPRVPPIYAHTETTPPPDPTPALLHPQHRVPRQPHRQTKDYHMTTNNTLAHRPSSKSERNLIILQVNINGLKNKLEEVKLLIHDTHADIITI